MSGASILVVDDEADIRSLLSEILAEEGYRVEVAADATAARAARARRSPDLVLLDIWMPDVDGITLLREWSTDAAAGPPVVMMSGHGTVETAVEATRLGAFDFVEKPLSLAKLLRTVERALEHGKRGRSAGRNIPAPLGVPVGKSRLMQELRTEIERVAALAAPVLMIGEAGTGRESFARYLHDRSARGNEPFVTLVASELRDTDAETALFGAETAQGPSRGALERAGNGTLFILELEDLPGNAQRLLFGVLETGSFCRVNGTERIKFAARIVSAARPGIETRALEDGFRRDLLGQLNTLLVRIPPLREYAEDVPELLRHYVDRLVDVEQLRYRRFSVAAQNRLRNYPWPDNVRELKGMVQRLLMKPTADDVSLEEVEQQIKSYAPPDEPLVKQDLLALPLREARDQFERAYLQQQLLLCHGKVGLLAKRVGMERTHLYRKLRSLGIDFRSSPDD
ncbi:MAG: sigma-54 dependent transcriptional regulator [Steroidobacteraceae bacterium]